MLETNAVKVTNGEAKFDNIAFIAQPGADDQQFTVSSLAVDLSKLRIVYGSNYTQQPMIINFRYCKPGEYITTSNI